MSDALKKALAGELLEHEYALQFNGEEFRVMEEEFRTTRATGKREQIARRQVGYSSSTVEAALRSASRQIGGKWFELKLGAFGT